MSHALFEPLKLRKVESRNRLWVAPMCMYQIKEHDGVPRKWHQIHLGQLAQGGFGCVTVEATAVVPEGRISPHDLGLWNDEQRDAFKEVTEVIKSYGSVPAIQLAHAGRKASVWPEWGNDQKGSMPLEDGGWETSAPSAIAFPGLATPQELTEEGIAEVVQAFQEAARRAVDAGFTVLEIHGAHGYLIHQFLSPQSNLREDRYGGSLENRCRLALEVAEAVRGEVGEEVAVTMRLSATDWVEGGWNVEDTLTLTSWLEERGVDLISVSSGGNVPDAKIPIGPGYQVPLARDVRSATALPVSTAGLILSPSQAEQIVATGQADVVLLGREALRNPRFPLQAAEEQRIALPYLPPQYRRAYR